MKSNHYFASLTLLCISIFVLCLSSCNKSDADSEIEGETETISYTITVGAYTKDNLGEYVFTGKEFIFDSNEECQTWSRTASEDIHSSTSHLHYNAAANVLYDHSATTFSWDEYGPEIDQQSIETTCSNGIEGVSKTVNDSSYYQDKPNLFLLITSVVEN